MASAVEIEGSTPSAPTFYCEPQMSWLQKLKKQFGTLKAREAGFSRLLPFIPGERPAARHKRRRELALTWVESIQVWCDYRGVEFKVELAGNRMMFRRLATRSRATWGFSTGLLNYQTDWLQKGGYTKVHCPEQLLSVLSRLWLLEEDKLRPKVLS